MKCPECGGIVILSTDFGQTVYCAQMHEWSPEDNSDTKYQLGDWLIEEADDSRHTIVDIDTSVAPVQYTLLEVFDGSVHRLTYSSDTLDYGFTVVASDGDSR